MAIETRKPTKGGDNLSVTVNVKFLGDDGRKRPTARAYLFDRAGRLLDSQLAHGATTLKARSGQDYRVTVGPDLIKDGKAPANLAAQLVKARAVSQDSRFQAARHAYDFAVADLVWICWFPTCINVHGTVRKLLNPGGSPPQYAPICTGTVQIFEVALDCTLDSFSVIELLAFKTRLLQRLSPPALTFARDTVLHAGDGGGLAARAPTAASSDLAARIAALDDAPLKQFIVRNKEYLFDFWCELIPDYAFCWQELTQVQIQSDGSFSSEICFWCPDDMPDLYFEVIQNIGGSSVEISDPQIACSTYYNYDGSSSVDITVDDPRAVACQPPGSPGPGYLYVWPTAIGNIDLGQIDGLETGLGTGLLPGDTPWGGTLCLQMQFHPDLQANNIHYYRWSYRFDGEADFTQIHASVTHRYETITISGPDIVIHLNPVTFGPNLISGPSNPGGTSNLFAIPDPLLPWIDIVDPADRPFAYFDSTGAVTPRKSGMCTLMLELFDGDGKFVPSNNARGVSTDGDLPSDPGGPGAFTYILPQIGGPPNTYANAPAANITDDGRMIFRILVDNNDTDAELPAVSTPSGTADLCGVLHYLTTGDAVDLSYVAWHPNNFLDWSLSISRGLSGEVAGIHIPSPVTHTSAGSPGVPTHFVNAASVLLDGCTQAAFAVNLSCSARAESGYGRMSNYDRGATIAFALINP